MPEDLKKEIFEYSRLDKLDMQKLAQFKAATMEAAAKTKVVLQVQVWAWVWLCTCATNGGMMGARLMGQQNFPPQQAQVVPHQCQRRRFITMRKWRATRSGRY